MNIKNCNKKHHEFSFFLDVKKLKYTEKYFFFLPFSSLSHTSHVLCSVVYMTTELVYLLFKFEFYENRKITFTGLLVVQTLNVEVNKRKQGKKNCSFTHVNIKEPLIGVPTRDELVYGGERTCASVVVEKFREIFFKN